MVGPHLLGSSHPGETGLEPIKHLCGRMYQSPGKSRRNEPHNSYLEPRHHHSTLERLRFHEPLGSWFRSLHEITDGNEHPLLISPPVFSVVVPAAHIGEFLQYSSVKPCKRSRQGYWNPLVGCFLSQRPTA